MHLKHLLGATILVFFFQDSSEVHAGFLPRIVFLFLDFSLNIPRDLSFSAMLSAFLVSILCVCCAFCLTSLLASCHSRVLPVLILCASMSCPPPDVSVSALWTLFQADSYHRLEIWVFSQGRQFHFLSVAKPRIHVCSNLSELHCPGLQAGASGYPRAAVGTSLGSHGPLFLQAQAGSGGHLPWRP